MQFKNVTNCAEFHEQLPHLMEAGEDVERHPHLATCENCRTLVRDLMYIAEQAKLLLPLHDPNPRVWNNIQDSLSREGLVKEGRTPGPGQVVALPARINWTLIGAAAAVAAVLVVTIGLVRTTNPPPLHPVAELDPLPPQAQELFPEDAPLIEAIEQRAPSTKDFYVRNLKSVNAYIRDARQSLEQDPDDAEAAVHLRQAYAHKAMLYRRASSSSFE